MLRLHWELWGSTETLLRLYWDSAETLLGLCWDSTETTEATETLLRLYWDSTKTLLRLHWDSSETLLRLYWDSTETLLILYWDSSEILQRHYWDSTETLCIGMTITFASKVIRSQTFILKKTTFQLYQLVFSIVGWLLFRQLSCCLILGGIFLRWPWNEGFLGTYLLCLLAKLLQFTLLSSSSIVSMALVISAGKIPNCSDCLC